MPAPRDDPAQHANRLISLAQQLAPQLQSDDRAHALEELESQHQDLERALGWLVDQGEADRAAHMIRLLAEFWWTRGHTQEGRRWAAKVLALPQMAEPTERRAALLDASAGLAIRAGDTAAQRKSLEEGLAIRRQLDSPRALAQSLVHLGVALVEGGDRKGWMLMEEALALSRERGLGRYARHALFQMARAALDEGDYRRAREYVREIVSGLRGSPDEWAAGAILELAAAVAATAGEAERALRLAAAGEAQRLAAGMTEQGDFGQWLDRMLEAARRAVAPSVRARAEELGRAMTRRQAFDDVLAE